MKLPSLESTRIAVIGLGYVGLPLALEFSKHYPTAGFDIDSKRIEQLECFEDSTRQASSEELQGALARGLRLSSTLAHIAESNVYIICVPTPIDSHKVPNLAPLRHASELVARVLQKGDVVIYESTTYPTCTESECKRILEAHSKLRCDEDFSLGYSPERTNPSDTLHSLTRVRKLTSGSNEAAGDFVDLLYASIIPAGTHRVSSIKVAEMSKILENAQRDLNIAFVNEACILCEHLGIDAHEVLEAARTKWNFLPFSPGLVGGHCISVDPYYLTHKMNAIGYTPQVISSGRLINEAMPAFVAHKIIKLLAQSRIEILNARVLILGITFKANCPDIRNSQVPSLKAKLEEFGIEVEIYDPVANAREVCESYHITLLERLEPNAYDGIFLAVAHTELLALSRSELGGEGHIFYTLTPHALKP